MYRKKAVAASVASMVTAIALTATPGTVLLAQENETSGSALEEVIVVARRREESLMETPVSITAFSAADLEARQIYQSYQLADSTPNLVYRGVSGNTSQNTSIIYIRGIGQGDFAPSVQPGVGVYVDGAYVAGAVGSVSEIYDIESIEVLRGPQGTLFGRNTIGGAILINTKKPNEEFSGNFEVQIGEREHVQFSGTINVPITDQLFGKVSVLGRTSDGWIKTPFIDGDDDFGSQDTKGIRGALRWLGESVTVDLTADYVRRESDGFPAVLVEVNEVGGQAGAWNTNVAPALGLPLWTNDYVPPEGSYLNYSELFRPSEGDVKTFGLTVQWDISSNMSFKSITSYREVYDFGAQDWDLSVPQVMEHSDYIDSDHFSQEFQLSGVAMDSRLNWLVGAYYFEEETTNLNGVIFSEFSLMSGSIVDNSSAALFGQLTYDVTDKFSVTVGGRYTDEKLDSIVNEEHQYITQLFDPSCTGACTALPPSAAGSPYPWSRRRGTPDGWVTLPLPPNEGSFRIQPPNVFESDHSDFEPYLHLSYQWNDDFRTYVSYSEGFKGGGFTQRIPPGRTVEGFGPEQAKVYELGGKLSGLDGRLRLSGAVFYTDYTDLQVNVSRELGGTLENASDAEITGFELEGVFAVTENFRLSGGVGYLDGEYKDLDPAVTFDPNEMPSVMEWQFNAAADYDFHISSGTITARLDYTFSDEYYVNANNDALTPDWDAFNGSITYQPTSEKWELALQARNLFDEYYVYGVYSNLDQDARLHATPAPPRQVILRFKYLFQ